MEKTVIVSATRTPFGKLLGCLESLNASDLGGIVIKEALNRAGIPGESVDHVLFGNVLQGGQGQVPSRQATRKAGLPWEVSSITVNKVCSSGIITIALADQAIRCGDYNIMIAGGMESMSNAPYYVDAGARKGLRMNDTKFVDLCVHDGLWCAFYDRHMAIHGSEVAKEYGISREEQDDWALRSQMLAVDAMKAGRLKDEIVSVTIPRKKGDPQIIDTDEAPRPDTTAEGLAKLPPIFIKDGSVTAGNAPGLNDGAGALVLMSESKAKELGIKPLATILGYAMVSQDAKYIPTVPGLSAMKLLKNLNMTFDDIDLIEANEAFAAVSLVSGKITGWDPKKVNINGGAIAFGHPIGASGARIVMTLIYELRRRGGGKGIACICSGAAQGDAMMISVE
ncbi:MAG: acetyl-CoA C-acetyltransferase [Desulfitobacteriaceae bacterium]|nr:acetyl-CoA C-acetyltransferase [Desulfitobacteriaceae bacterium]MDD4346532.1 acetyl-CoA C-acetyltransferase [Desulfitobacteriaceae bacterium]MDD4401185.1 acetyl-CoA C-acetyltransferase [Desulfitobacteriaceae bacterium]